MSEEEQEELKMRVRRSDLTARVTIFKKSFGTTIDDDSPCIKMEEEMEIYLTDMDTVELLRKVCQIGKENLKIQDIVIPSSVWDVQ